MISTVTNTTHSQPVCEVSRSARSGPMLRIHPGGWDGPTLWLSLAELDALIGALTVARPELAALSEPVSA